MRNMFTQIPARRQFVILALLLGLASATVMGVWAAVTLQRFGPIVLPSSIRLEWETASELDNAGFYLRSGPSTSGPFTRISTFIPSRGDSLAGATYAFTDTNVVIGTTYFYELEAVALNQVSTFYGPVSAALLDVAGTQTATVIVSGPTRTATATATAAATATHTAAAATPTATQAAATAVPTVTSAYPGPATSTLPSGAAQSSPTAGGNLQPTPETSGTPDVFANQGSAPGNASSATATLIPLPEITLQFATPTPAAVAMASGETASGEPSPGEENTTGWLTPGRAVFLGLLALIWVILGVWFYFSLRKLH